MAGKSKGKKKGTKPKNAGEKKEKKKPKRTGAKRSSGTRSAKSRCNVDVFSEAAMDNAYYTCHNVQDMLMIRGFAWPEAVKKKKKGKGGGGKGKKK